MYVKRMTFVPSYDRFRIVRLCRRIGVPFHELVNNRIPGMAKRQPDGRSGERAKAKRGTATASSAGTSPGK